MSGKSGAAGPPDIDWSGPPPLGPERPFQPPRAVRLKLEGGGALLVVENRTLPLVTVQFTMAGAGSTADPVGRSGLAAYTANLMDESAGGLTGREIAQRVEKLGSEIELWVEEDAGFLRVSSLTQHLAATLDLAGKVLGAPAFDATEGRRIHEDQLTSIRLRRDRPGAVAQVIFDGALFGEAGAYGHPPLGYAREFTRVTVEDARAFYRAHWSTERLLVVVAGDVAAPEVRRLVDASLAGWRNPAPATPPTAAAAPPRRSRLLVVDRRDAEQTNVMVGTTGLRRSDPDAYALEVLLNLLGGTYSSRLNNRLREQLGYTYGIDASATYFRDAGSIALVSALATPTAAAALAELLRIVDDTARTAIAAPELVAAQQNLVRGLSLLFNTNEDVVDALAGAAMLGLPDDWFQRYAERIRAVSASQVLAVARRLLAVGRLVAVVVGPMALLENDLARLGFGSPRRYDPDGIAVKR